MYGYYWEHTEAQIELLALDCPVISYGKRKDKKKAKAGSKNMYMVDPDDVRRKVDEWERKYKGKDKGVTFDFSEYSVM